MKKTFLCVAALLCLLCTFVLTGCPREPEEEPYKPWTWGEGLEPAWADLDNDGEDEFKEGRFKFSYTYHFENMDYCSFELTKRYDYDYFTSAISTDPTYEIWFTYEGDTGDWDSDNYSNPSDPYFDKAYFENTIPINTRCTGESGHVTMIRPQGRVIDRVFDVGEEGDHGYLSEWFPSAGNYSAGEEWVLKFESSTHSERNLSVPVPADAVSATITWLNSLDEKTLEILQACEPPAFL